MHELKHECGVFGMLSKKGHNVYPNIYNGLLALQHRGEDACGIGTVDTSTRRVNYKKNVGHVPEYFFDPRTNQLRFLDFLKGELGLGHVRYVTEGDNDRESSQPFFAKDVRNGLLLEENGHIPEYERLKRIVEEQDHTYIGSTCDAEVILRILAINSRVHSGIFESVKQTMVDLNTGAYAILFVTGEGQLVAFRDPYSIRPLCYHESEDFVAFASESCALYAAGLDLTGNVGPGEVMMIGKDGKLRRKEILRKGYNPCSFEFIYFAFPDSVIDGLRVATFRRRVGEELAKREYVEADALLFVPESSENAANGYSSIRPMNRVQGLVKNRAIGRTFIARRGTNAEKVKMKLRVIPEEVAGKRLIVIDDSVIRGPTAKILIRLLRDAGASEVHMRIASPPAISSCHSGIAIPTKKELLAGKFASSEEEVEKNLEQIQKGVAKAIGADTVMYATHENIKTAFAGAGFDPCMGCFKGKYPNPLLEQMIKSKQEKEQEGQV